MRTYLLLAIVAGSLLHTSCSQAQDNSNAAKEASGAGKPHKLKHKVSDTPVPGLRTVGSIAGVVNESSSLLRGEAPNTYFTQGDDGNPPIIYKIDDKGNLLGQMTLPVPNQDWESLARDEQGNVFVGDCGNNNSDRRDLAIYRFRPDSPQQVGKISFTYPDQQEFPPAKKRRNFDCEATLWYGGKIYLFTKDRGQQSTCKVYTLPDQPGTYVAQPVAHLALHGEVTDATLRPDGHRLVLLARQEMFVFDGNSLAEMLRATPHHIDLTGAGQTEGVAFKDPQTLLITTEQGNLYEYSLPDAQ